MDSNIQIMGTVVLGIIDKLISTTTAEETITSEFPNGVVIGASHSWEKYSGWSG